MVGLGCFGGRSVDFSGEALGAPKRWTGCRTSGSTGLELKRLLYRIGMVFGLYLP
jgi:hypothetical protein